MALTPSLNSIEDLFGKLEREAYRAYHADKKRHKADHFYNYCVTAHAMKDYFFERKGTHEFDKEPYRNKWNDDYFLVAATEIANTAKHFELREKRKNKPKVVKTKEVKQKNSLFVDISIDGESKLQEERVEKPDLIVTLQDGSEYEMWEFTNHITEYWREILERESINVQPQSVAELLP